MRRTLIINADDLGLTPGVNDGIFESHDLGVLTSASLFANAPATADAISRARTRPLLDVGCHLALVDGEPTLPPARVPTLVGEDGRFRPSWRPFIADALRRRISLDDVERELTAQIDRLRGDHVNLTHLDSHKHVHLFPPIFAIVVRVARRFGIGVVRVPFERSWSVRGDALQRRVARRQALFNLGMWPWAHAARRRAAAHGLRTPEFSGLIHTGVLNAEAIAATLRSLRPGATELMVHPGHVDPALARMHTRLLTSREQEVQLLLAGHTRDLIAGERIELVRRDLSSPTRRSLPHAS